MNKQVFRGILCFLLLLTTLLSCEHERPQIIDPWSVTTIDSLSFRNEHHYWKGYHLLATDSLSLATALPGEVGSIFKTDTIPVVEDMGLVVINVVSVPSDSIDSTWVMVAHDVEKIGWVREQELLSSAIPDNFISQFIHAFSGVRMIVLLCCLLAALVFILIQSLRHARFQMVHFNDIKSVYPTLLCMVVSGTAVLYGALQQFAPEVWKEFYYHPTLNLFADVHFSLRIFLMGMWAILIVGIAVIDDLRKQPGVVNAFTYLAILSAVCMLLYLFFSLSVHYYVGYPLVLAYWLFALKRHFYHNSARYRCGHCGNALQSIGKCPYCGAINEG